MSSPKTPQSKRRYVGAYMVFECYKDIHIPIISISTRTVSNNIATAVVQMHPSPFIHMLTRGINVYIVCVIQDHGVSSRPLNKIMFIGDIDSVQASSTLGITEYYVNLVDNRRYVAELPSFYLKLIRTQHDANIGYNTRSKTDAYQSPIMNYSGAGGVMSLYDEAMDANFYGIAGKYLEENMMYDITDLMVVSMMERTLNQHNLIGYVNKLLEPLKEEYGWEPYYINMNKKKHITDNLEIHDSGLFRAAMDAKFAEAAWQSIKDSHVELSVTYHDAITRLSEVGYVFNTNLFPTISGVRDKTIVDNPNVPIFDVIKSALLPGELINIVAIKDGENATVPDISGSYPINISGDGVVTEMEHVLIYSLKRGDITYYAIVRPEIDPDGNTTHKDTKISEYNIVPKLFGVIPPKCNWELLREGVQFNAIIQEPPITALKLNLTGGLSNATVYSCAYPGDLEFYSEQETGYNQEYRKNITLPTISPVSAPTPKILGNNIDSAIKKYVPREHADLVRAIVWVESSGDPLAHSSSGARGLMQVVPASNPEYDANRLYEVDYNIWAGYNAFTKWLKIAKGNIALALSQYNAGYTGGGWTYSAKVLNTYREITGKNAPQMTNYKKTGASPASVGANTPPKAFIVGKYMNKEKLRSENVYGIKRVIIKGSQVAELQRAMSYAEHKENNDDQQLTVSRDQKMDMIKQKVKSDYYESTVSRNTGTVSIRGLAEDVMVGLPYIIFHPIHKLFYYGFVEEISHRVDNTNGFSSTDISLSGLTTVQSISEVENMFAGYIQEKYCPSLVEDKNAAIKEINKMYGNITHTDNITMEEYTLFDATDFNLIDDLINLLTSRAGRRNICTIERLHKLYYGNKAMATVWNAVADKVCPSKQWITARMQDAMQNLINDYARRGRTNGSAGIIETESPEQGE